MKGCNRGPGREINTRGQACREQDVVNTVLSGHESDQERVSGRELIHEAGHVRGIAVALASRRRNRRRHGQSN